MERADAGKSDGLVHGPEEGLIPFRGPELVTGGERVARVDTDCEAFRMRGPLDDFRELREAVADDGALARGAREDRCHVRRNRALARPVQALGERRAGPGAASS